jgi:hypothetical protein
MFATLGSLADRAFIVGFILPVLGFLLAMLGLFADFPAVGTILREIAAADGFEKLTYLVLSIWALAMMLQFVNDALYKMLEGYSFPLARIGFLRRRQQRRFDDARNTFIDLNLQLKAIEALVHPGPDDLARKAEIEKDLYPARRFLITFFPFKEEMKSGPLPRNPYLLPTRFGNAIRAFEIYSGDVYGIDSIPLWLHLATVAPKDFQSAIDSARAQVDCLVNVIFLSLLFAAAAFMRFLTTANPGHGFNPAVVFAFAGWNYLLACAAALALARIAYGVAIERACAWGAFVKVAFDCYLPALAKQLGFRLPAGRADQKRFWTAVSRRVIFHQPFDPKDWPADDPPPSPTPPAPAQPGPPAHAAPIAPPAPRVFWRWRRH